jgi:threonine/homoserine/homoserine lactone efflux protein
VRQLVLLLPVWLGLAGYGVFAVAERSRLARHLPRLFGGLVFVVLAAELALAAAGSPRLVASGSVDERGKIIQDAAVRLTPGRNSPGPSAPRP